MCKESPISRQTALIHKLATARPAPVSAGKHDFLADKKIRAPGRAPPAQLTAPDVLTDKKKVRAPGEGPTLEPKTAGMRSIIDDIIKGASQNSFGRPVSIQADTEWTHLDTAKTAGVLQALGERGYSVKQASAYLGLTEAKIQSILATVR